MAESKRYGRIAEALARYPVGRSKLYEIAQKNPGLIKKLDDISVVDFQKMDRIIAALPDAKIVRRPKAHT